MTADVFDLRAVIVEACTEAAEGRKDRFAFCADCRDQTCVDHQADDRLAWEYVTAAALIGRAGDGEIAAILAAPSTTNRGTE